MLGNPEFLDHVHPTIEGNRLLGRALLDHLVARGVATLDPDWNDAVARSIADAVLADLTPRDHAIARRNLSMVLRWAGKNEEADRLIASAIEAAPDDAESLVLIGREHWRDGELDQALAILIRALTLKPDFAAGYASIGAVLRDLGRTDEALEACRRALRLDPDDAQAHGILGMELA